MASLISRNFQPGSPIVESLGRASCWVVQALLLLLHVNVLADTLQDELQGHTFPDLKQLASQIKRDSPDAQSQFATIALTTLVEIHLAEADLARNEAHQLDQKQKLLGWAGAVEQFADLLILVMNDVEAGFPIEISYGSPGPVALTVADRMILLNHPRADQQQAYELQVLLEFCTREACTETATPDKAIEAIALSSPTQPPQWKFNLDGPVCFSDKDAIQVQFHSTHNMSFLRSHCEQLFYEIRSLQGEIRSQQARGITLNWDALELLASPGQPEHIIQLNRSGDTSMLSLPLLHSSPQLLDLLRTWLQAETQSGERDILVIDGIQFGWEDRAR